MDKKEMREALLETAVSFETLKERIYWEEVKKQRKEIERLKETLKEIADIPPAPYSMDRLKHANNTINEMSEIAKQVLKGE